MPFRVWVLEVLILLALAGLAAAGLWLQRPYDDLSWITYEDDRYGVSLRYPSNWVIDVQSEEELLDVHLMNARAAEAKQGQPCPEGYAGLEIQAGLQKGDQLTDFATFVATQVNTEGLGPFGALEPVAIGNWNGWRVQQGGWVSPCPGPGYFVQQDTEHYIYIMTGSSDAHDRTLPAILASLEVGRVERR